MANWSSGHATIKPGDRVAIIGAGLAGCFSAAVLAERGVQVTLLDAAPAVAGGASGNPVGALYFKPSAQANPALRIQLQAYWVALQRYAELQRLHDIHWHPTGLLMLATDEKERQRQAKLLDNLAFPEALLRAVDQPQAEQIAGAPLAAGGMYFPQGGWLSPLRLCQALAQQPGIKLQLNTAIQSLRQIEGGGWLLQDDKEKALQVDAVVVAAAHLTHAFDPLASLPLKPIRGQITTATIDSDSPVANTVVCGDGYYCPPHQGRICFGATFDLNQTDSDLRAADHRRNLQLLARSLPPLANSLQRLPDDAFNGRAAVRCATPDYLPMVGPVADEPAMTTHWQGLKHNAHGACADSGQFLPGLFVNVGHGSKGLLTAPLCAELLADLMLGTPAPCGNDSIEALHPARFLIRRLIRGG